MVSTYKRLIVQQMLKEPYLIKKAVIMRYPFAVREKCGTAKDIDGYTKHDGDASRPKIFLNLFRSIT